MSRLVDVLKKADAGDIVGVVVAIAAGFLALNGILEMNITEIALAGLLVPAALWFGRSLKKEGFPPDVDPPGAL